MNWAVESLFASPNCEFSSLFVNAKDKRVFVADMAVYTKNRAMRLLMSSKFSKDKSKKPLKAAVSFSQWKFFLPYTFVTGAKSQSNCP